jgi:glycosyltransferase involved in cell wall biosynthesis
MKVCIVQSVLPLYAISFFNRIVEINQDIQLVLLADLKSKDSLNQYRPELCKFEVKQLDSISIGGIYLRPKILRVLHEINSDVTVFSASPREWSQLFAIFCAKMTRKKTAAWGMFHRIGGVRIFTSIYFRLLGKMTGRCLTYTRIGASQIVSKGVSKASVCVVGTAIDERQPFKYSAMMSADELRQFRHEQGIEGKKIILQVVRLTHLKRPELLLYAMKRIVTERDDVLAILIGDGNQRSELEELAVSLGIKNSVRFLGSIYDEKLLCPWYLSSEVFVVPTFLGLSGHHAMSYGLPVVTDDSLDHQGSEFEIVAEGLNGFTYREGDAEDLSRVMLRILSNASLQAFLSLNAKKTIENTHNIDRKTNRFVNSLREL